MVFMRELTWIIW